ncbi:MAG TPA: isocitrate lyase/phosphoenolpyruvate mutase family protein [Xanthobacteraceae bacterium]|nr:isocitrate lyase/phosphoenolpyruvate mutase family protein [Xanthobacteraceae bacterium]
MTIVKENGLAARLKSAERERGIVVAPGVYDALSASIAAASGFDTLYLSGAAIAYCRLGRPDIGLVSSTEVAETIALVRDRVDCALIVDADTGYGNALNVQRTVRLFERAGASAIQLEDQVFPKRCGHLSGKAVIPAAEMVGKIKAAVDARQSEATLIVGRTDAAAVEDLDRAIERGWLYADAGADILFIEAPRTRDDLQKVAGALGATAPLLANMVEGGNTPLLAADELAGIGFRLVIFPGGIVRALARTARDYYANLKSHGTNVAFQDRMFDFHELNDMLGTAEMLENGRRYEE